MKTTIIPLVGLCFVLIFPGCQNRYERHLENMRRDPRYIASQKVQTLKIGMSTWDVIQTLGGRSTSIVSRVTAEGRTELWTYSLTQLQLFQQGSSSSFMLGFGERINRDVETYVRLTFLNDKLVAMEGV